MSALSGIEGWKRYVLAGGLVVAMAIALLGLSGGEARADIGIQDTPRIKQLIYPTLGNPVIIKSGEDFTIEWDPRAVGYGPMPEITGFQVSVTSSNDDYPVTCELPVLSYEQGSSREWPTLSETYTIYRVTVNASYSVPHDLYDLTVKAKTDGAWVTDTQPHAVQTVDEYKDRFSFCHLTDIHVFGPECNGAPPFYSHAQTKRDFRRPKGEGAVYYKEAIEQLNRMKPDFCVYTGDYIFGQEWKTHDYSAEYGGTEFARTMSEYEFEMDWFYEETLNLDVPVFITVGNHDGYRDDYEDWLGNFQKLFGPLYFGFEYGPDYRFLAVNSMDWSSQERKLIDYFGIILQPAKYLGSVRNGGDTWQAGWSQAREDTIDEDNFFGQLGWARDYLKDGMNAKMRVWCMHHDPWKDDGSGSMWASGGDGWLEQITGAIDMGDGDGRLSCIKLMRDYDVALSITGHDHSDYVGNLGYNTIWLESDSVGSVPWNPDYSPDPLKGSGEGEVNFVNTTSTQFQKDGDTNVYPGYRRIWINDGDVESFNYKEPKYSYPWYAGTNIEGTTDLTTLNTPAVDSNFSVEPGSATDVTCTIINHLEKSLPGAYVEFPMPYLSNGYYYKVSNGSFGDLYDNKGSNPDHRICQVYTDVGAGSTKAPRVYKSSSPDSSRPSGSVKVNNGANITSTREVTLNVAASDTGGSGLKDMMISNRDDFQGAGWEKYSATRDWTLASGAAGKRTVYVKFRDAAMPPNVSEVCSDEIVYSPGDDDGGPTTTWYFAEGCTRDGFEEWISLQNPNSTDCEVDITYMTEDGENIPQTVTVEAESRATVDVNSVVGPGRDVSVALEATKPIMAERPMYFNYQGMWKGGHVVIGTNNPRAKWYFAEGCTREYADANFHTWLCIQNPQEEDVTATITYMPEEGDNVQKQVVIPAMSRKTECANWDLGAGKDVSIAVEADNAVICERPVYFQYQGWDGGHDVIGASGPANDWYVAEGTTHGGFSTYVCMQNPNDSEAKVTLDYMLQEGTVEDQEVTIPARSRKTVFVNDWVGPAQNVSVHVSSDKPIITERPMYFNYGAGWPGGHCVVAATSSHDSWYFAEGCTRAGFEQWFSVQNPSDEDAEVMIRYLINNAENVSQKVDVPGNSRYTVNVNEFMMGNEYDLSATLESSVPVIVERPMYFLYKGAWPGGHCVVGSGTDLE